MRDRPALVPERVRSIGGGSFGFLPHRFLRDGFLASLTADERSLYLFLVLAADRQGLSFYGYDRICSVLELRLEAYLSARNGLMDKDLVAFDGLRFQVLSLPERPVLSSRPLRSREDLEDHDPATVRHLLGGSLPEPEEDR
jgi:hypothetical protein